MVRDIRFAQHAFRQIAVPVPGVSAPAVERAMPALLAEAGAGDLRGGDDGFYIAEALAQRLVAVTLRGLWGGTGLVPAAAPGADAALTRLLRAMMLLKGLMVAGAVAILWPRLGRDLPTGTLLGYALGAAAAAAGVAGLWTLTAMPGWVLLFYLGLGTVGLSVWRDPGFGRR